MDSGINVMKYEIVHAAEEDREEVLQLYKAQLGRAFCLWDEEYPGNGTIDFDLERDSLFIMKIDGRIAACISVEDDEDVDNLPCWDKALAPGGELARLAVLPELQNRGIARIMLQYGMEELKKRGFRSVHFLVGRENVKAVRSYSHFGFHKAGECFMYGHEYLCYEKELSKQTGADSR